MSNVSAKKRSRVASYPRTGKRGVPQQFPRRLFEMLQSESNSGEPSIISWSDSGNAFRIFDATLFATRILPKYFRTAKFSSFQRNLNLLRKYNSAERKRFVESSSRQFSNFVTNETIIDQNQSFRNVSLSPPDLQSDEDCSVLRTPQSNIAYISDSNASPSCSPKCSPPNWLSQENLHPYHSQERASQPIRPSMILLEINSLKRKPTNDFFRGAEKLALLAMAISTVSGEEI
eukprot:scaffold37345_cov53-Attheya_sp.AAC.2